MFPKQTDREKKTCVTAAYQTCGSKILFHCGVRKYLIPFIAPGKVKARASKMLKTK
jgi:hypothetical protein